MGRVNRIIVPGIPHHITQRGNRREVVFFEDDDRRLYLRLLKEQGERFGIRYWAYCLMSNHVHLIAVPEGERSFSLGLGEVHRRYTNFVNEKKGWTGHLWQSRYASFPMNERHVYAAMRYVELNPVKAGLVKRAQDYPWSSARAHVLKQRDPLLEDHFLKAEISNWEEFLSQDGENRFPELVESHSRTGRPMGDKNFIEGLERKIGRPLQPGKPGRPRKEK